MRIAVSLAIIGFLAVFATLGISWMPSLLPFPGMTSDEPFSVTYGSAFIDAVGKHGTSFLNRDVIETVFGPRREHPPLARWLIGLSHLILGRGSYFDGRGASAVAFSVCLFCITRLGTRRHNWIVGVCAGVSLLLMPRVFAHAHFAALETLVLTTWLLALISSLAMMETEKWRMTVVAGIALGAALLTKMHGILLLPLIMSWAVLYYRKKAFLRLAVWLLTGFTVFFMGWPWLWHSTWDRTAEYFGRAGVRARILVSYPEFRPLDFDAVPTIYKDARDNEQFLDIAAVPWHYPWVMTAVTLPIGILLLGLIGLARSSPKLKSDPLAGLFFIWFFFPLVLFSFPSVPVYDGVRLFLMVFPAWAYWSGLGAEWVWSTWSPKLNRHFALTCVAIFLLFQAVGVARYHPFQLSYYNVLVGGLRGASTMGFEPTYWGDTITPDLVNRWSDLAKTKSEAVVVPTLYANHAQIYTTQLLLERSQRLVNLDPENHAAKDWVVYNRRAYIRDYDGELNRQSPLVVHERDGVWLGAVFRFHPSSTGDEKGHD